MEHDKPTRRTVRDFMVKSPITVEHWQPVAQARQLMLTHSFSFLPIKLEEKWRLVSELALAKYLHQKANRRGLLATSLADAAESASGTGLELVDAVIVNLDTSVADLLKSSIAQDRANLWLITDDGHRLVGVLSPFELM